MPALEEKSNALSWENALVWENISPTDRDPGQLELMSPLGGGKLQSSYELKLIASRT